MGIQYAEDGSGEILGYWVRTTHPGDTKQVQFKWFFVPAERMLHVLEEWFPGQSRGYPWMRRTLDRWRDGEDLDEAGIIAAQVETCNAAFVHTRQPLKAAQNATSKTTRNGMRLEDMKPGQIRYLDADSERIEFNNPTKSIIVGTLHEWNHRRIAAGLDWPYEFLMKDWRGMSFAGGRLILNGAQLKCEVAQQIVIESWLEVISNEVVSQMVLFGVVDISLVEFHSQPWIYQQHTWTPPAWGYAISPGEDIAATVEAVENNQMTLEEAIAKHGGHIEDVLKQRQKERAQEREYEIEPPARIAAIAQQGKATAKEQAKENKVTNAA